MSSNEKHQPNNEGSTKNKQEQKTDKTSIQVEVKIDSDNKQLLEKIDKKLDQLMYLFDDMANMIDELRGSFSITEIIMILLLLAILIFSFLGD
jgi:enoyl-[acyl-carrier-protein] reductase (NADH)